jgi:hypothetical protein
MCGGTTLPWLQHPPQTRLKRGENVCILVEAGDVQEVVIECSYTLKPYAAQNLGELVMARYHHDPKPQKYNDNP